MLKDPECAARYEESLRACEAEQSMTLRTESAQPSRELLTEVQTFLAGFPQVEMPLTHYFAPGMYGRELFIPADTYVVGKTHRHSHIVMLMSGEATINTDKGVERIKGPKVWVSPVGAKRGLRTHTDCTFFTCHATEETDLDKLEAEIIEPEPSPFLAYRQEVLP